MTSESVCACVCATRHDLLTAFHAPLVASQCQRELVSPPATPIDTDLLTILAADVLAYPVEGIEVLAQVGRFVHVEYTPIGTKDPDIVLCYAKDAQPFHAAMMAFQHKRTRRTDWGAWYAVLKAAAHDLITPLLRLDPHPAEADFVLRWALLVCARGKTL